MTVLFEICRDYRATIFLCVSFLKISELCDIPSRFYDSLNGKNQMCELCMFSQIQSHVCTYIAILVSVYPS